MSAFMKSKFFAPAILALFCLLTFGIFIPFLGIYSDDWVFLNAFQKFGHAGLTQYYETNRPILGLLFQITMPVFGKSIVGWHLFAMGSQFLCALALRWLILTLWPTERLSALIGGILFIVYPGFTLLPISITFGHTYLIYLFFLLSTVLAIKAAQYPKKRIFFTLLSLVFTAANLFMMEYFFCLTFIQPFILLLMFSDAQQTFFKRILKIIKFYSPWILMIGASAIWRIFIFRFQTYNYGLQNISAIKTDFLSGILKVIKTFFVDIFKTGVLAWFEPIQFIAAKTNQINLFIFTMIFILAGIIISYFLLRTYDQKNTNTSGLFKTQGFLIALVSLALAGWPFWVTGLNVTLDGMYSRFTLPFILGSTLLVISCLSLIKNKLLMLSISAIVIGLALGKQFSSINEYRQEYKVLTSYMNQLQTRIPNLKPGAFIISNDLPFPHFSDATLTAIIDWFYTPQASSNQLDHVFVFSKDRHDDFFENEFTFSSVNFHFASQLKKSISTTVLYNFNIQPIGVNSCLTTLDNTNITLYKFHIQPQSAEIAPYSSNNNISYDSSESTNNLFNYYFPSHDGNQWCQIYQNISRLQDEGKFNEISTLYSGNSIPSYYLEIIPYLNAFKQIEDWESFSTIMTSTFAKRPEEGCLLLEQYSKNSSSMQNNPYITKLTQDFRCGKQ